MNSVAKQIADKWQLIIESISVDGYSRKVESANVFRMEAYYTGYPEIEYCYKVNFNFNDSIGNSNTTNPYVDVQKDKWHKKLNDIFTGMFWNPSNEVMPRTGSNSGETKFENSRVDYMTDQGYRFIVQFYPDGFLSELRDDKLEELGI